MCGGGEEKSGEGEEGATFRSAEDFRWRRRGGRQDPPHERLNYWLISMACHSKKEGELRGRVEERAVGFYYSSEASGGG